MKLPTFSERYMERRVDQYLLDKEPLTDALIRRWAYDPDAELMEQDEDLVLHDWEFTETILELAADPSCPKAEYILSIWEEFTRHHAVHQVPSDLEAARHALAVAEEYGHHPGVSRWIADQTQRLKFVDGAGPTDEATALAMADTLLNGAARSCPITVLRESCTAFLVQLSVPHGSHKEWLLIDKRTGKFRYSRYWPSGSTAPEWFEPIR